MGRLSKALERRKGTMRHGHITPAARKRYATLPGGRFPMPDKAHARKALQMLPRAKGLSAADAAKIRARAHRILGDK